MRDLVKGSSGTMTRREFSLEAALALLATCVITVSDCGGNKTAPTPPVTDVNGTITNNHGHIAVIKAAQITDGNAISLNIQGAASHPHTVDVTQADLSALRNRQPVAKESSNNSFHSHTVTFTPA